MLKSKEEKVADHAVGPKRSKGSKTSTEGPLKKAGTNSSLKEMITEHIHWFLTSRCNLSCKYCFNPRDLTSSEESEKKILKLADILMRGQVRMVTLSGGEPTLVKSLETLVRQLKSADIHVRLHTNGTLLDEQKIGQLVSSLDSIALPIDSLSTETQDRLGRIVNVKKLLRLMELIRGHGIGLDLHTVVTPYNIDEVPSIYRFLKDKGFHRWRIYEFNGDMVDDRFSCVNRFQEVHALEGEVTKENYRDGGTKTLFARFLMMEERMKRARDRRIQFVGKRDKKAPYVFLDNSGDVRYCTYFTTKRVRVGNLLGEDFDSVQTKLEGAFRKGPLFDQEGFVNSFQDMPLFVRIWEGNIFTEEVTEDLDKRHLPRIVHLAELYRHRIEREDRQLDRLYRSLSG